LSASNSVSSHSEGDRVKSLRGDQKNNKQRGRREKTPTRKGRVPKGGNNARKARNADLTRTASQKKRGHPLQDRSRTSSEDKKEIGDKKRKGGTGVSFQLKSGAGRF